MLGLDSLVSSQVYEIIRTIYTTTASEASEESRIKVLQSTLGQLRLNNIATLDAITTHFTRLIDLTSADEAYVTALAQNLAPCILRPRTENNLTMDERHSYRLIRDLLGHKQEIFDELKRQSGSTAAQSGRPRTISSDESNRRANTEERNRAIANRSRANSPAPAQRHRRDRSTGGSESTRFPINVGSPTTARRKARQSLDVPNSADAMPVEPPTAATTAAGGSSANGDGDHVIASPESNPNNSTSTPMTSADSPTSIGVEKSGSQSRSSGRYSRITGLNRDGTGSAPAPAPDMSKKDGEAEHAEPAKPVGVTLEDKPMDD